MAGPRIKVKTAGIPSPRPVSPGGGRSMQDMIMMQIWKNQLAQQMAGPVTEAKKDVELAYLPKEETIKAKAKGEAKMATEQANVAFGASKEASSSRRFVQQFERAYDEADKTLPGFGEIGITGKAKRLGIRGLMKADYMPETQALAIRIEPMANQMARDVEGGRVTDQDRQIYAKAFANTFVNPSKTNSRLIAEQLIGLADKGGDISKNLEAFSESNNPVLQDVYKYVVEQHPKYILETGDVNQNDTSALEDELRKLYFQGGK